MKEKFADTDGLSEAINRRPGDAIPKRKRKKINSVPHVRHIRHVAQQYDKIICTFYVQLNLVY
jgi:hypothetical protein